MLCHDFACYTLPSPGRSLTFCSSLPLTEGIPLQRWISALIRLITEPACPWKARRWLIEVSMLITWYLCSYFECLGFLTIISTVLLSDGSSVIIYGCCQAASTLHLQAARSRPETACPGTVVPSSLHLAVAWCMACLLARLLAAWCAMLAR